jgi:imidazolonepropionase-like amidohydrolase
LDFRYDVVAPMTTILLHTAKAITPAGEILDAGILIRDGVIEAAGARADVSLPAGAIEIKATDQIAVPGLIDVHIHGAGGREVMDRGETRHDFHGGDDRNGSA